MCSLFAHQPAERYKSLRRSVRLSGHSTSISLEQAFWDILEEIAQREETTLPKFLTQLYDEVLDHRCDVVNFTSLLRCACIAYVDQTRMPLPLPAVTPQHPSQTAQIAT
jgi:predicted DNA-binding ribbon-helix-helix protein